MTLVQKENIKLDRSVPQWKKELLNRKRSAAKASGTLQITRKSNNFIYTLEHVGKQRDVILTANEKAVDHSRQPDFHLQQRASLSVSQRLFVPAVDNMKLLNEVGVRDSAAKTRSRVVNNLSRTECIRENYVKHVIEMNEKKCFDKIRFSFNKFSNNSSRVKIRSLSPPSANAATATAVVTDDDNTSDSSEELQYGPGIVNKLKTKYLSMTLRENQKKGVRPSLSNLRKANSLDNLLEDESVETNKPYQINTVLSCVNKFEYSSKELGNRLNFSADLKRARSMEALNDEKGDSTSPVKGRPPPHVHVNGTHTPGDSVDCNVENVSLEAKPHEEKKRLSLEDKELPPPDLVKETLKIFENCHQKAVSNGISKTWNGTKFSSRRSDPGVLRTVQKADFKKPVCGKPVLYPKPIITHSDSKVLKFSPKKQPPPPPPPPPANSENNSQVSNADKATDVQKKKPEERKLSIENCNKYIPPNDKCSSSPVSLLKINFELNKQPESVNHSITNGVCTNGDKSNLNAHSPAVATPSTPEKVNSHATAKSPTNSVNLAESPPIKVTITENHIDTNQILNDTENKQKHDILKPSETLPVRQIGIIRPLFFSVNNVSQSNLTPQEIEKNYINAQKNLDIKEKFNCEKEKPNNVEDQLLPVIEEQSPTVEKSQSNSVTKPSTLWFDKPWNQQQNTMVFNFKDRKEVPDYIENDGLLLTTNRDRAKVSFMDIFFY